MLECNELERSMFMNRIAELVTDTAQLMSIDKAAHNSKTSARKTLTSSFTLSQ